jgi:hypothetical protein
LDAPVAPEGVLFRQSPDQELGLERNPPSRVDPMRSSPFSTHEFAMPAPKSIRRD